MSDGTPQALSGIRVLEFGSLLAGPLCGRLLGDFGAEIIKVEAPERGDLLREWGATPINGDRDALWSIYSRNKKCITLNLREQEGRDMCLELIKKVDVIVENFRPGTLEKWGLGPDEIAKVNPDLIMVRVSGYGQTGPYREKAGFGSIAEAMGGIRYTTGFPDRPPTRTGVSLGDSLAALMGTIGALTALVGREKGNTPKDGKVQIVDVAIYEAVFGLMESLIPDYTLLNKVRERSGSILPGVAPSNVYPCNDGVGVLIAANGQNVYERLCKAMGREDLITDPRFAEHQDRGRNMEEIDAIVSAWTETMSSDELIAKMDEFGVPVGKIYTAKEMLEDEHFAARGMINPMPIENGLEFPMPGIVPKLSKTPGETRHVGSLEMGSHNEEVYGSLLGYDADKIAGLKKQGLI